MTDSSMSMSVGPKQAISAGWKLFWSGVWAYVRRKDMILTAYFEGNYKGKNA